jgi:hypothetical protein
MPRSIRGWPSRTTFIRHRLSLITVGKFNRGPGGTLRLQHHLGLGDDGN